jgi:hypothetical protein
MLNNLTPAQIESVIDYVTPGVAEAMATGRMNTDDAVLLANIRSAVRRGHPQMRTWPVRSDRICLVGSGPSLAQTEDELRELVWTGAQIVTVNGGYHWCIAHGFRPNTQIVIDARPTNAKFVNPFVPHCRYVLASQCAPETWDAVQGRPDVWIFHSVTKESGPAGEFLDAYYAKQWIGVSGGTTVASRAMTLLRMAGYVRFDLFGIDCCWQGTTHHVVPQPENDADERAVVEVGDTARPETMRRFVVSAWQLKQFEDFLNILKINGQHFRIHAHGDGMLAYILRTLGATAEGAEVRSLIQPSD